MPSNPNAEPFVVELSLEAVDDIQDILQYTCQTWGERQVASYQAVLDQLITHIFTKAISWKKYPAIR